MYVGRSRSARRGAARMNFAEKQQSTNLQEERVWGLHDCVERQVGRGGGDRRTRPKQKHKKKQQGTNSIKTWMYAYVHEKKVKDPWCDSHRVNRVSRIRVTVNDPRYDIDRGIKRHAADLA